MRRVVRLMLMWLLALALPVQGVSASTLSACATHQGHFGTGAGPHSRSADSASHHAAVRGSDATPHSHAVVAASEHGKTNLGEAPRASAARAHRAARAPWCRPNRSLSIRPTWPTFSLLPSLARWLRM